MPINIACSKCFTPIGDVKDGMEFQCGHKFHYACLTQVASCSLCGTNDALGVGQLFEVEELNDEQIDKQLEKLVKAYLMVGDSEELEMMENFLMDEPKVALKNLMNLYKYGKTFFGK